MDSILTSFDSGRPIMDYDVDPVYMKDVDVNDIEGNIILKTCYSVHKQFPGEIHGAQKMSNYLKLYPRSNTTRAALIVRGITIENKHINIYDDNPLRFDSSKSERVLIKDLPASIPPHKVLTFLKGYSHITVRSKVIYAKERMAGDEMSPFINGDRIVYISPNVSPPLPKEAVICGHPCRLWHASQKNFCKRCALHGHRTTDMDSCESYDPDSNVTAFRSDNNPLSNFYSCTLVSGDITFKSVEHFYQFECCMNCDRPDLAQKVIEAESPKLAKQIAYDLKRSISPERLAKWFKARIIVMENALKLKWNSCAKFRQALMQTSGMTIAEATQDTFWGVGVAPNLAQETRCSKFIGDNHLGRLLMGIRDYVIQREPTSLTDVEFPPPSVTRNNTDHADSTTTQSNSTVVDSAPPLNLNTKNTDPPVNGSSSHLNDPPTQVTPPVSDPIELELETSTEKNSDPTETDTVNDSTAMETATVNDSTSLEPVSVAKETQQSTSQQTTRPSRPSRKLNPKSTLHQRPSSIGTLDRFVSRTESPSTKRKLSEESLSPASVQNLKSTRTDGADKVS